MGDFTITIVIPTIGRPTLARALRSVRAQALIPGDEVLVAGDGPQPQARELWDQLGLPGRYLETPARLGSWGHGARNWLLDRQEACGAYLMALDDDDELTTNAVGHARDAIIEAPGRPLLFRMRGDPCGGVVWRDRVIRHGEVGTPMLVCPNDPARLGRYGLFHGGDRQFIEQTCGHYAGGPAWREEVICLVRPASGVGIAPTAGRIGG